MNTDGTRISGSSPGKSVLIRRSNPAFQHTLQARRSRIAANKSATTSARGLKPEVAFAVDADGDVAGFEVAFAEDEHGVDFPLLGVGDLGFDRVAASESIVARTPCGAEFGVDAAGVVDDVERVGSSSSPPMGRTRTCSGASQSGKLPA